MIDIRPGDWLSSANYHPDFLGKEIQRFQRVIGLPDPAWRFTHAEVVLYADNDVIKTFSQTFPKAIRNIYSRYDLEKKLVGDKPTRFLHRIKEYDRYATRPALLSMERKAQEIIDRKPSGWAKVANKLFNYDFLQLPNCWVNLGAHKLGYKGHVNWLEIPGGIGFCSDKAAEVEDALFWHTTGKDVIFTQRPNSEVVPGHIWTEPMFEQVLYA
jgi:hypothetical protein